MKPIQRLIFLAPLVLGACQTPQQEWDNRAIRNMWVGDHLRRASIEQATITQSTLFPYHFVGGTAQLTPLGERELKVLAKHFATSGGHLNIKRSSAADELYEARVAFVRQALNEAGVGEEQVTIGDGRPGGYGRSSDALVEMLASDDDGQGDDSLVQSIGSN